MNRLTGAQADDWLATMSANARVHLVGVGGCGMSGLAHLMIDLGFTVTGSDIRENAEIRQLQERGARIILGHAAGVLEESRPDLVVYSSAIRTDNPEMAAAARMNLPIIRRAVLLAAVVRRRQGVCVAGMHGKTTTTALLAHALEQLAEVPGYAVGAMVPQLGRHARLGPEGAWFAAETDESDGTLREFHPAQSIVLNIDEEHLDYYANFEAVCDEFVRFADQTKGVLFYCADDPRLSDLYGARRNTVSFGFNLEADYRAEILEPGRFEVFNNDQSLGDYTLRLLGEKNVSNALAIVAFLHRNGFAPADISIALGSFLGANRRQQELFADERFKIFDDYGHHPQEIRATLRAMKEHCGGRLLVAFQPHRYSRTQHLLAEFAECFDDADLLWVTEVYAASEAPIADVHGRRLASEISGAGQPAAFVATLEELREKVRMAMHPGDVIIFLGAGDITRVAHEVAGDLKMEGISHATALKDALSADSVIAEDEPLAGRTTLGVGGTADIYVEPANEQGLALVLRYATAHELPVFFLGRGSNLLIRDGGIRGLVISLKQDFFKKIEIQGNELHCGAGVRLRHLANAARDEGVSGLEFMEGIPGCLGGALRMNAGAMGRATFDTVVRVRFMTRDGQIEERPGNEMNAVYRGCPVLRENIALGAVLQGSPASKEEIRARMEEYRQQRTRTQPHYRSAGCMFKNPDGTPAGKLVDECGLKGLTVGGASVSELHGNFMINDGQANADEVLELIRRVQAAVRDQRGIELKTEVQIVGE